MKKLFLLLALGGTVASADAQDLIPINSGMTAPKGHLLDHQPISIKAQRAAGGHQRTTTADTTWNNDWFDYWNANVSASATNNAFYFNVYPDSNLLDPTSVSATNDGYLFCHGMGVSFDPTDRHYYSYLDAFTAGISDTPAIIQTTAYSTPYTIDSFFIQGKYIRNNPSTTVVDTLVIDLISTYGFSIDSGTYRLHYNGGANYPAWGITATGDTQGRVSLADLMPNSFATFPDECWDSILTKKVRLVVPLTNLTPADTTPGTGGDNDFLFALANPLSVSGGDKVVCYAHFKSGVAYPLGTNITAANYYHLYAGDPQGASTWPQQTPPNSATGYNGSFQTGLLVQNQNGYGFPTFQGHNLPFSPFDFINPAATSAPTPFGFEVPFMAFHAKWVHSISLGVNNVVAIKSVNAYPNPANDVVTVAFNLANATNVSVTLTNMMGQTVATENRSNTVNGNVEFNTSSLPDGVYIYTVSANGERSTGRVLIAH